jgi:hypothetical protein
MKTGARRTVQEWIELRKVELSKIEKNGSKLKPIPRLSLVPRRRNRAQQLELSFGRPEEVQR